MLFGSTIEIGVPRVFGRPSYPGEIIQKAILGAAALSVTALSLSACGADVADACENYVESVESCTLEYADAAGVESDDLLLDDAICVDTYGDLKDRETVDYLNCLADAYDAADCSTADGYAAVGTDALDCVR